jgi:hypothetical protein
MSTRRRLVVQKDDVLVVKGMELDVAILEEMLVGDKRLLWAFLKNEAGDLQPVPYSEDKVIWLTDDDLVRSQFEV